MELFYAVRTEGAVCMLDEEQTRHCVKVLRYKAGDAVKVIDGRGNLLECRIREIKKEAVLEILSETENFGSHPYVLEMAVAPTKNIDRYEWFLEKATELGVDRIVPVIGDHSERRTIRPERLERILISAAKQSLKGAVPVLTEPVSVRDFVKGAVNMDKDPQRERLKLIAYCGEGEKASLRDALGTSRPPFPEITVLIGPEGDFSPEEVACAVSAGYRPVHLGMSRLRTETAAVAAVAEIYFSFGR